MQERRFSYGTTQRTMSAFGFDGGDLLQTHGREASAWECSTAAFIRKSAAQGEHIRWGSLTRPRVADFEVAAGACALIARSFVTTGLCAPFTRRFARPCTMRFSTEDLPREDSLL